MICELAAVEPREEVEYAVQEAAARLRLTPAVARRRHHDARHTGRVRPRPGVEATELTTAGWRVPRLTARHLRDEPLWVIAQLTAVLRG